MQLCQRSGRPDFQAATIGGSTLFALTARQMENFGSALDRFEYDDAVVLALHVGVRWLGLRGDARGVVACIDAGRAELEPGPTSAYVRAAPTPHTNAAIFAFAGNAIFAAVY